jgi:hypothetical protein
MRARLVLALLALGAALLLACGDARNGATFDPVSPEGGHPSGWLPEGHSVEAFASLPGCSECHGADFLGGISGVACTDCHLGNQVDIHPLAWDELVYARHAGYVETNGTPSCALGVCHGQSLTGVQDSGPSCVTACHLGGESSIHPLQWGAFAYALHDTFVQQNGPEACANGVCHGAGLNGVTESGPACDSCHLGGDFSVHPLDWTGDITAHGDFVTLNGSSTCANSVCHGRNLQGVLSSGISCFACHTF